MERVEVDRQFNVSTTVFSVLVCNKVTCLGWYPQCAVNHNYQDGWFGLSEVGLLCNVNVYFVLWRPILHK